MTDSTQSSRRARPTELLISGFIAQDLGDRAEQQDRVAILTSPNAPGCALGVLADGMGGRSGGALAAENVVLTSRRRFGEFNPQESTEGFFKSLIDEAHTVLRLTSVTSGLEPHSTFAAVLVQPERIDWCHVGDSRIYHIRDRKLMHCTSDHTYMHELVSSGKMNAERARLHPSANTLVNALGSQRAPVPELGSLGGPPQDGDTFLLCSDGLWNYFHAGEIVLIVDSMPLRDAARTLLERARQRARGQGDNCSLILLQLSEQAVRQEVNPAAAAASLAPVS